MVLLLLQVVLRAGDISSLLKQTPDQTSLDMGWMVGPEVKVAVCVCGLSVDGDVQGAITLHSEQGVEERNGPLLLYLSRELDGWAYTVEVVQECLYHALLHNATGVIDVPLPEPGCQRSRPQGQLFKELHVEVGHSS